MEGPPAASSLHLGSALCLSFSSVQGLVVVFEAGVGTLSLNTQMGQVQGCGGGIGTGPGVQLPPCFPVATSLLL